MYTRNPQPSSDSKDTLGSAQVTTLDSHRQLSKEDSKTNIDAAHRGIPKGMRGNTLLCVLGSNCDGYIGRMNVYAMRPIVPITNS